MIPNKNNEKDGPKFVSPHTWFFCVKMPKTASSTLAGVNMQIAIKKQGQRLYTTMVQLRKTIPPPAPIMKILLECCKRRNGYLQIWTSECPIEWLTLWPILCCRVWISRADQTLFMMGQSQSPCFTKLELRFIFAYFSVWMSTNWQENLAGTPRGYQTTGRNHIWRSRRLSTLISISSVHWKMVGMEWNGTN